MEFGRRYCQACLLRPDAEGGYGTCPLLKGDRTKTFDAMWAKGLGDAPGHECGAFKLGDRKIFRQRKLRAGTLRVGQESLFAFGGEVFREGQA